MVIAFYTSGHGFGHASRDLEVMHALVRRRSDARCVVRTAVPRWFFDASARTPIDVQPIEADTGVVQIDSLRLDEDETARAAARFYATFEERAVAEAAVIRDLQAAVVVGDVPPLAFAAARLARVPSVMLANFTWDWIYDGFPQFSRLAPSVIDVIRDAYATTDCALRLPLHGGFETVKAVTRDIPLVARRSVRDRNATRSLIGIDNQLPVVLASFGRYGVHLPWDEIVRAGRFTLVVTDAETGSADPPTIGRLRRLSRTEMTRLGLHYEDLVAAADVVVSKPGYGIVSECIANRTPLLYTSRGRFVEQDMFVREMPDVLQCRYIVQEDLLAGRWSDAVDALLRQPLPPRRLETDGADVAADAIAEIADRK